MAAFLQAARNSGTTVPPATPLTPKMSEQLHPDAVAAAEKWQQNTGVPLSNVSDLWMTMKPMDPVAQHIHFRVFVAFIQLSKMIPGDRTPDATPEFFVPTNFSPLRRYFSRAGGQSMTALVWKLALIVKSADPQGATYLSKEAMADLENKGRPIIDVELNENETKEQFMARCQKQLGVDGLNFMAEITDDHFHVDNEFLGWLTSGLQMVEQKLGVAYDKRIHSAGSKQALEEILREWAQHEKPPQAAVASDKHSADLANETPDANVAEFLEHLKTVDPEMQKKADARISSLSNVEEVGETGKDAVTAVSVDEPQKPPFHPNVSSKKRGLAGNSVGSPKPKKPKRAGSQSPSRGDQHPLVVEAQKTNLAAGGKISASRLRREVLRMLREGKIDDTALATFVGIKEQQVTEKSHATTITKFEMLRLFNQWLEMIGFHKAISLADKIELLIRGGPMLSAHTGRVEGGINAFCTYLVHFASRTARAHQLAAMFPHIVDRVVAAKVQAAAAATAAKKSPAKEVKIEA